MSEFNEETLGKYFSSKKVPKQALSWLYQLLFKELKEFCDECEDDRMGCVLSPHCEERILLKVRMQAGAKVEALPKFCYSQSVNNLKRHLQKNTTLYKPVDVLLYNSDFIDIMFPRLYSKILAKIDEDIDKVHKIIEKSRVPAVNLDIHKADNEMFRKIIQKDKLIREGTFIYDIQGKYLIVWYEGDLFITNLNSGITTCNAKHDIIEDTKLIDLIFHIDCAELNCEGKTELINDDEIKIEFIISFKQIQKDRINDDSTYFQEFNEYLQKYFYEIKHQITEEQFTITVKYNGNENFLERKSLQPTTYEALRRLVEYVNGFGVSEEE